MFSASIPLLWSPTILVLDPGLSSWGCAMNLNAVPCKYAMETARTLQLWGIIAMKSRLIQLETQRLRRRLASRLGTRSADAWIDTWLS